MKTILAAVLMCAAVNAAYAVTVPPASTDYAASFAAGVTPDLNGTAAAVTSNLPPVVTSRANPMLTAPVLRLRGCPAGQDWYKEPGVAGAVAFCRPVVAPVAPPEPPPVVVADNTAAPDSGVVVGPSGPVVVPTENNPLANAGQNPPTGTTEPVPAQPALPVVTAPVTAPVTVPVVTAPVVETAPIVAAGPAPTSTTGGGAGQIGTACNGQDWMTQRTWSDGRREWLYVPGWMNHSSATPFIDPQGVVRTDIVNSCG